MNYIFMMMLLVAMSACERKSTGNPTVDMISEASYGTTNSRVQFHENAEAMRLSPEAAGYDDISGATFEFVEEKDGLVFYNGRKGIAVVSNISPDSVVVLSYEDSELVTTTFSPRGTNLGIRPR